MERNRNQTKTRATANQRSASTCKTKTRSPFDEAKMYTRNLLSICAAQVQPRHDARVFGGCRVCSCVCVCILLHIHHCVYRVFFLYMQTTPFLSKRSQGYMYTIFIDSLETALSLAARYPNSPSSYGVSDLARTPTGLSRPAATDRSPAWSSWPGSSSTYPNGSDLSWTDCSVDTTSWRR